MANLLAFKLRHKPVQPCKERSKINKVFSKFEFRGMLNPEKVLKKHPGSLVMETSFEFIMMYNSYHSSMSWKSMFIAGEMKKMPSVKFFFKHPVPTCLPT